MRLLLFLLILALPSISCAQLNPTEIQKNLRANEVRFQALVKEKRTAYMEFRMRAKKADAEEKSFSAIRFVNEAQDIFIDDAALHYIKGKAYARLEKIDLAIENYERAIKLNPMDLPLLAELIEINYFSGRYKETLKWIDHIEKVFALNAKLIVPPLINFKKLICMEKLKSDEKEMAKLRKKYTYLDSTPFYYFSVALDEFKKGKRDEAMIWIAKASYIFMENSDNVFAWSKAMIDAGYVEKHEILLTPAYDAFLDN